MVAIGASAGGLEALQQLFAALPHDTGAAWVVVQHLSPDHKSMMDNLLARHTAMPVCLAEHGQPLKADAVYLIPPGMTMRLAGNRLQLAAKPAQGLSLPVDIFFESLAAEAGERAVAVVLSGSGSDGSRGVQAVHGQGGHVLVQDPSTARFDGMPRSALATGVVEHVGSVPELATALQALLSQRFDVLPDGAVPVELERVPLDAILDRLHQAANIDFRQYKPRTVLRRIQRRMQLLKCADAADYLEQLDRRPDEAERLRRELLIPVTHFFRDPDVFALVQQQVLLPLALSPGTDPLRIWVAACATGEEAYSIAMLMLEAFEQVGRSRTLKVFATDAEPTYLEQAAAGLYSPGIEAEVTPQRLERFFVRRGHGWQVRAELRQHVIFARHNLVSDPPFTRMNLVSCRNALIYLQPGAQEQALQRLQYALLPQGHLLLGSSESLGALQRNFSTVNGRAKLFRLQHRDRVLLGLEGHPRSGQARPDTRRSTSSAIDADPAMRLLAQAYLPPTLRVSRTRELLHVYGDMREWLALTEGQATLDVLRLLPRELAWTAGLLLRGVFDSGQAQVSDVVRIAQDDAGDGQGPARLRLVARPLLSGEAAERPEQALLSFELLGEAADQAATAGGGDTLRPLPMDALEQVEALELQLSQTQRTLQATIEELETSNEELQATNEEMMASNEELQSTNEELQSVNEELYTVNSEYQQKVEILNALNADLENVSQAAALPTLFVDDQLHLLRFSTEAAPLFKLREGDVGRRLDDFAHTLDYPSLFADVRHSLVVQKASERQVRSADGRWWLVRIQPYKTRTQGGMRAVLSFFDISVLKQSERLQSVLDSLAEHVAVLDEHGTITMVNAAWQAFACAQGDSEGRRCGPGVNYLEVCARAALAEDARGDARQAHAGLQAVLAGRLDRFTMRYPCFTPTEQLWFLMHVAPVRQGGGAVVSHIDVTQGAPAVPPANAAEAAGALT